MSALRVITMSLHRQATSRAITLERIVLHTWNMAPRVCSFHRRLQTAMAPGALKESTLFFFALCLSESLRAATGDVGVWAQHGFNAQKIGRSPFVGTSVGALKWTYRTNGNITASPVLDAAGLLAVPSLDGYIYLVFADSGLRKFNYPTNGPTRGSSAFSSGGAIYFTCASDGCVMAINATSGSAYWEIDLGKNTTSSLTVDDHGMIYIGVYTAVMALLPSDGGVHWMFERQAEQFVAPPAVYNGSAYVGSVTTSGLANVYSLDATTGAEKWSRPMGSVYSSPAIDASGIVYVGSADANVYALDARTGTVLWKYTTGASIVTSPAISVNGTVYVSSGDGKIYALDGRSGSLLWHYQTNGAIASSPAVSADSIVYVGSDDANIYALDGKTGALVWNYATGGRVQSSPCLGSDNSVYVGSDDGFVYAFHTPRG
jgi:outer membrane protein assembly factor BamB